MSSLLGASIVFILLTVVLGAARAYLLFEFAGLSLLLFRSQSPGKWFYSLLFLPGTILHELSHWIVAELCGVRTGEIKILPDLSSDQDRQTKLGSVQTARSGPLRSFLIGAAPFFTGLGTLWILGYLLVNQTLLWWQYLLVFYGIVVVGSSMLLSKEDRQSWPFVFIFAGVIAGLFYLTPIDIPKPWLTSLATVLVSLNRILAVTVVAILAIITIAQLIRRIIEKILGKKIVRS